MFDKKIFVHDLKPGMFVSALDRPWLDTPFLLQGFLVETDEDVAELRRACRYVYIDLARSIGGDLDLEYALAKKGAGGQDEQRVVEVAVSGNMRSHADVSDARPAATAKSSRLSKNATTQPNVINPRPTAASHKPVTTAPLASAAAGLRGNHRATDDAPSSATKQLPNQAQNRSIGIVVNNAFLASPGNVHRLVCIEHDADERFDRSRPGFRSMQDFWRA